MTEYEHEPIPGLPGLLPKGEHILWQGSPDWRILARTAFHTRAVAGYFALLVGVALLTAIWAGIGGWRDFAGVALTLGFGVTGVALLHLLAWGAARTTIYTLTDRRIVMRIGIALPKCINIPLGMIANVDLAKRDAGTGDLALALSGEQRLGYAALWPHARAWHYARPQPMLRAVPGVDAVATMLARACMAVQTGGRVVPIESAGWSGAAAEAQAA